MHSQDCKRILMLVFYFRKNATVFVLVRFPSAFSVCVCHNQSGYLAFVSVTNIREKSSCISVPGWTKIPCSQHALYKELSTFPLALSRVDNPNLTFTLQFRAKYQIQATNHSRLVKTRMKLNMLGENTVYYFYNIISDIGNNQWFNILN